MANTRIFQLPDLSGNISGDDLIIVDKFLGLGSYTTGFKKITDIINNINAQPLVNFTNVNNAIITTNNNVTILDNSIEPRIETHTQYTPVVVNSGRNWITSSGTWQAGAFELYTMPVQLQTSYVVFVELTTVAETHVGLNCESYVLQKRMYILRRTATGAYTISDNWLVGNENFGPDAGNMQVFNSISFGAGQTISFRQRGRSLNTFMYYQTRVKWYI